MTQAFTNFQISLGGDHQRGRVAAAVNSTWPTARHDTLDAVTILFTAGHGTTQDSVPRSIKDAIRLLVGHRYENREAVLVGASAMPVPEAFEHLITQYDTGHYPR